MVATILAYPRTEAVNVAVVTRAGATTREGGSRQQVQFAGKKKAAFDIAIKKYTFFEAKHVTMRNKGKSPVVEMPSSFNPSVEERRLQQHGTLQQFFERCLSLVGDPQALVKIEKLLYHQNNMPKDSIVYSIQKKKTGK